jgi:hypothetical protein
MKMHSLLLSAFACMSIFIFIGCSENVSNYFESYKEAKDSGIISRGWIPEFIPRSSYEIKEHHKVDVPYINVEFKFDREDIDVFKSACILQDENTYMCRNTEYPVKVFISGGNHAVIESVRVGT